MNIKNDKQLKEQFKYKDINKNKLFYKDNKIYKKDKLNNKTNILIGLYIPYKIFTYHNIFTYMFKQKFKNNDIEITPMNEHRVPILWNIFKKLDDNDIICLISDISIEYRITVKKAKKVGGIKYSKNELDTNINGVIYIPLEEMKKVNKKKLL